MLYIIGNAPTRGESCRSVGDGQGLAEEDAGYNGDADGRCMIELVFGEADGVVSDAVDRAEFFEEQNELTQFSNEPVFIICRAQGVSLKLPH